MAQDDEPEAALKRRQRILVADRRPQTCADLTRLLGNNYEVRSVSDARAVLAVVDEWAPALIVADAGLRTAAGFAGLRGFHVDGSGRVPIVWYSTTLADDPTSHPSDVAAEHDVVVPLSERYLLSLVSAQLKLIQMREDSVRALRESEERFHILKTALT